MAKNGTYDRSAEDIGNVVALEHVNVCIPDQRLATLFYITGLGLTRDPYLVTSVNNMWVNIGRNQFHLPTNDPLILRGRIGVVIPGREGLLRRLENVKKHLEGTKFSFKAGNDHVDATCPWGNRFRIHEPGERFGRTALGIAYVEFEVPEGTAGRIAKFYRKVVGAPAAVDRTDRTCARVQVGYCQELVYTETARKLPKFDGHHIQIYLADFSGPYRKLAKRGLISEESNQHQYRFEDIVDLDSGEVLFKLDHEIRSLTHPLFARPIVNRNPDQTNMTFAPGHETVSWALPYGG